MEPLSCRIRGLSDGKELLRELLTRNARIEQTIRSVLRVIPKGQSKDPKRSEGFENVAEEQHFCRLLHSMIQA